MGNIKEIHNLVKQGETGYQEMHGGHEDVHSSEFDAGTGSDSFNAYMSQLRRTPLLKPDEEQRLTRLAKQGSEDARRKVLQANLRLVVSIARKYCNRGLDFLDLISEGNTGLIRALDRYEPDKGFRFSTYATYWIREAILRAISNDGRLIRLPAYAGQDLLRYQRAVQQLQNKGSRRPTKTELAGHLGISVDEVHRLSSLHAECVSLDAPLQGDEVQTFAELVADETAEGADVQAHTRETSSWTERLLGVLSDRQRLILGYRFGLYGAESVTLDEIAEMLHLSRERVRQLEKEGLKNLRQVLSRKGIALADFY